jgi:type I restriction enzyme M protein
VVYETVEYADPKVILAELKQLEKEILQGMNELEELL